MSEDSVCLNLGYWMLKMNRNPVNSRPCCALQATRARSYRSAFLSKRNYFNLFAQNQRCLKSHLREEQEETPSSMYAHCVILGSQPQSLGLPSSAHLKIWKLTSAVCLRLLLHGNREILAPRSSASVDRPASI
jgi:hypothetical protein